MAIIKYIFLMGVPLACTLSLYKLLEANQADLRGSGNFAFLTNVEVKVGGSIAAFIVLLYISFEMYKRLEINTETIKLLRPFRRDFGVLRGIIAEHDRRHEQINSIVGKYNYKANYEENGAPKEAEGNLEISFDNNAGLYISGTDNAEISFHSDHASLSMQKLYFHWTVPVGQDGAPVMGMASLGFDKIVDGKIRELSGVWGTMGGTVGRITYMRTS